MKAFALLNTQQRIKLILSPLLAWLIWKWAKVKADEEKIVDANFRITAFFTYERRMKTEKFPLLCFIKILINFVTY